MRHRSTGSGLLAAVALFAAACSAGSGDVADLSAPIEVAPTEVQPTQVQPTEVPPTQVAEPLVLSGDARLAAAVAVFEADPQPADLVAYDILETAFADGQARITICGWDGGAVFDEVSVIMYRAAEQPGPDGEPDVAFESARVVSGDECLNTTAVESALQATRDFDEQWRKAIEDPASFDEEAARLAMTEIAVEFLANEAAGLAESGRSYRAPHFDSQLPDSSLTEVLGRWTQQGGGGLQLIACRALDTGYGLYEGSVLVDDFKSETDRGDHVITRYLMVREGQAWKMLSMEGIVWADCLSAEEGWLAGVNASFPGDAEWEVWVE